MSNILSNLLILSLFSFINITYAAFGKEPDKMIMFQGQEKYLMHLIIQSAHNHKHPFSTTQIIRKENNKFHHHGDILDLQEHDFQNIHNLNYVFLENHTHRPTRLSNENIVPVSLLILGTTDKQSCLKLNFKQRCNQEKSIASTYNFMTINHDITKFT